MTIRRAVFDDIDALLPLVRGYREFYKQRHDEMRERVYIAAHLRNNSSVIFIAVDENVILGFAQLFTSYSTVRLAPSLILEDLFVLPEYRGSGIATALLEASCAYAREVHAAGMFLETAIDNETAQRVYERGGWNREGRFYKYNAPV